MAESDGRRSGAEIRGRSMSKNMFRALLLLIITMLLLFLTSRCSWGFQSPEVDWYYTIPDGYQGFLVIRYDCADGDPLMIKDGKAYLEFNDNGTACIKDAFQASHGQVFAQYRNGQSIRLAGTRATWNQGGYAFYTDGVRGIGRYGKDYGTFEIMWVGDLKYLAVHYLDGLDQFLEDRFGIPTTDSTVSPKQP
jgi:hypothetical protein